MGNKGYKEGTGCGIERKQGVTDRNEEHQEKTKSIEIK
jgi:hypothetical protein